MDGTIVLANGTRFEDAEGRIREYCNIEVYRDREFRGGYDDRHNVTDSITKDDIEAANNLYARLSSLDSMRILGNHEIPGLLIAVKDTELGALTGEEWNETKALVRPLLSAFISIQNVKLAKTMKVLHLKRPHLLPILDSFVVKFLTGNDMVRNWFSEQEILRIGLDSLETTRKDIVKNRAVFDELRNRLSDLPTPLTTVRMYDILCWTQEKWVNRLDTSAPYGVASMSVNQSTPSAESPSTLAGAPLRASEHQAGEAPVGEISTTKEFRQIRLRAEGVIVNTASSPPRAHRPLCEEVTEERFQTTMIFNEGKHGKYYLRGSLAEAVRDFAAEGCKKCRPERPARSP
jgi:hypothetical protein